MLCVRNLYRVHAGRVCVFLTVVKPNPCCHIELSSTFRIGRLQLFSLQTHADRQTDTVRVKLITEYVQPTLDLTMKPLFKTEARLSRDLLKDTHWPTGKRIIQNTNYKRLLKFLFTDRNKSDMHASITQESVMST